ncbi:hypothetical protein VNO80_29887 [Phaseolus coccineus]|uniref:Uncharacterized protein n=1 Tax=Phaseolus coccineus TaxID=3886 RepID=A0AAN9QIY0_PHACN
MELLEALSTMHSVFMLFNLPNNLQSWNVLGLVLILPVKLSGVGASKATDVYCTSTKGPKCFLSKTYAAQDMILPSLGAYGSYSML